MADNNQPPVNEKPANFGDDLKIGLGIGFLPMLVASAFFGNSPNAVGIAAAISLALWACCIGRLMCRQGLAAWSSVLGVTIGCWLIGAVMISQTVHEVGRQYRAIEAVETFAKTDFERFDIHHEGKLTSSQLRTVIGAQEKVKQAVSRMDEADAAIDALPSFDAQKTLGHVSVNLAKQTLQSQLLPDATIDHARVVADYGCVAAGGSKNAESCSFTVDDLKTFRVRTETQYAYWLSAMRWLGWL